MRLVALWGCLVSAGSLSAQAPSVHPRGVLNAVTLEPAPSRVAPGGLVLVQGINLGPVDGWTAATTPLPTEFGDPPTQLLINGRPAALLSATPGKIVAQVPWETPPGLANVVVRRGETRSRPATVRVMAVLPAVRTRNEQGFGEADAVQDGSNLKLSASGLGITEPRIPSGATGTVDPPVQPRAPVRAFLGGLPAPVSAMLSPARIGEYDLTLAIPEGARRGDVLHIAVANQAPGNRALFGSLAEPEVRYVPLPRGAQAARQFRVSDLRGDYLVATAPRSEDGCYPAWLFDLGRGQAARIDRCLIAAQPNAPSPIVTINEGSTLAALVGPPSADGQTGLTKRVALFQPARPEPLIVELPAAVSNLLSGPSGNTIAIAPGEPPMRYSIDAVSGEVAEPQANAPAQGGGAAPVGRVLDPGLLDLGDGLTHQLSPLLGVGQGQLAVLVGDDPNQPKKVELAVIEGATGNVASTHAFPVGWLPLFPPLPPTAPTRPGGAPDAPQQPIRARAIVVFDGPTRTFYTLAARTDSSAQGFVALSGDELEPSVLEFPEGWYAATCSPQFPVFQLELSRRVAFLGALAPESEAKTPCLASGYLFLDRGQRQVVAAPLPGQGQITLGAGLGDMNDYLYGANSDPANRNRADTLYVLDSVAGSAFRLDLPLGVTGFTALQPVPELGALLALAIDRVAGDAGFVWFNLETEQATLFPVPEGFNSVQPVGVFQNTRKLVARGIGATGSQLLVYDLTTGDLGVVPNPEGVAWVGNAPAQQAGAGGGQQPGGQQPPGQQPGGVQPPTPGGQAPAPQTIQVLLASTKSNSVVAMGFGADRQPVGLLAVRIP